MNQFKFESHEQFENKYKTELNFIDELNLTRHGMIKEIETEFNIIRLCLSQMTELDEKYTHITDRIVVMPLRKLLCEKKSVLLNVCPNFKMPKLEGYVIKLENGQNIIRSPFVTQNKEEWINIEIWLQQRLSWFDRTAESFSYEIPEFSFECIKDKLNEKSFRGYKKDFESKFYYHQIEFCGKMSNIYSLIDSADIDTKRMVFGILEEIGYNTLSIYTLIKHLSDKRGAHIDVGHSLLIDMVNYSDTLKLTPIHYFAIQMIYAAKKQIPELSNYWSEMPDLINELGG